MLCVYWHNLSFMSQMEPVLVLDRGKRAAHEYRAMNHYILRRPALFSDEWFDGTAGLYIVSTRAMLDGGPASVRTGPTD